MATQLGMLWAFRESVLCLIVNSRSRTALKRFKAAWDNWCHLSVNSWMRRCSVWVM